MQMRSAAGIMAPHCTSTSRRRADEDLRPDLPRRERSGRALRCTHLPHRGEQMKICARIYPERNAPEGRLILVLGLLFVRVD
jgi:hypothetical protein